MRRVAALAAVALAALLISDADARRSRPRWARGGAPVRVAASAGLEDPDADHAIVLYGQSLSAGVEGAPALTTTQPYSNTQLNLAKNALADLVEGLPDSSDVETQASQIGNTLRELLGTGRVVVVRAGVPGAAMSVLESGTANYDNLIADLTTARTLTINAGRTFRTRAIYFVHGESDHAIDNTTYQADLVQLQADLETDINTLQGTTGTIPIIVSQLSAYGSDPDAADIPIQQLEAARANPTKIVIAQAKQHFDYAADDLHGINTDYRDEGKKAGQVLHETIWQGSSWDFSPQSAVQSGTNVDLVYSPPTSPIAFNTTLITSRTNNGFDWYAGSILSEFASITGTSLPGSDVVRVAFSHALGASWGGAHAPQVRYAYEQGSTGAQGGHDNANSPSGNLVDSDAAGYGVNHALHSLDSITGLDPIPSSQATRSFQMPDGNEHVIIPDGASLDFTDKATWSFIVRFNDVSQHNLFFLHRNLNAWSMRFFSTGPNRSIYLNLGGAGNSCRTLGDLFADGEFHHVWITYDGTQAAGSRCAFVVDGVRAAFDEGGTVPATIAASTSAIYLGWTTGADMNLLHFAHWPGEVLTSSQAWVSGAVRAPVHFDGTGGVDNPPIFIRPDASDDCESASGVVNHGSETTTYDATCTNMTNSDIVATTP